MNDKFGQFDWHCFKDKQPDLDQYLYVYDSHQLYRDTSVDVGLGTDFNFDEHTYWCYVYIPDAPKIEKKLTIEERLEKLEKQQEFMNEYLQNRANHIEDKVNFAISKLGK